MKVFSGVPSLLPGMGFWSMLHYADAFVVLKGAPWNKEEGWNRTLIDGREYVHPVAAEGVDQPRMGDMVMQKTPAKIAHYLKTTVACKRNRYAARLDPLLAYLENTTNKKLLWVNLDVIEIMAQILGMPGKPILEPEFSIEVLTTEQMRDAARDVVLGPFSMLLPRRYKEAAQYKSFGHPVEVQYLMTGDVSVVQLIAQEDDPLKMIRLASSWA